MYYRSILVFSSENVKLYTAKTLPFLFLWSIENPKLLCRVWNRGVLAICGYHGHGFGEPPEHGIS